MKHCGGRETLVGFQIRIQAVGRPTVVNKRVNVIPESNCFIFMCFYLKTNFKVAIN